MIETERRTPSRDFAARCDEVFDTPGTFTRLEERLHDLPHPASFRPFAGYEAEARALRMFEHVLIPGLLHARAIPGRRGVPHTWQGLAGPELAQINARLGSSIMP
jgi:hypothetical protein